MAMRLIRTDAPTGSVVEDGGLLWRVGGESPHWPGEAECEALTCPRCGQSRMTLDDSDPENAAAVCGACGLRNGMDRGEPDELRTAIDELIAAGLWVEEAEPATDDDIAAMRARARSAHAELMELHAAH